MRILITGGEGVLGKFFKNMLLGMGEDVYTLDLKESADFVASVSGEDAVTVLSAVFRRVKPEIVMHLAAYTEPAESFKNIDLDARVNIGGTINVLRAMINSAPDAGIVFTSSCAVYGNWAKGRYVKEDDQTLPVSPYGVSKLAAEGYVKLYAREFGLKYQILRLGNVYSPWDNKYLLWRLFSSDGIVLYDGGMAVRDFVYVGDVLEFLLKAWREDIWNDTWNIGHEPLRVKDVAEYYVRNYGNYIASYESRRLGELEEIRLDISKALSTGWKPRVKLLGEGMRLCVEAFGNRMGRGRV